jgi:hypothetical protein
MALRPQLAEDVLSLIQKHPDITQTQEVVLKLAATLLAEDVMGEELHDQPDLRLLVTSRDFDLIPGTIEVWDGLMSPKDWSTPNRLARAEEEGLDW